MTERRRHDLCAEIARVIDPKPFLRDRRRSADPPEYWRDVESDAARMKSALKRARGILRVLDLAGVKIDARP